MNQRMIGRSQGGFTTCLVLRADTDGKLTDGVVEAREKTGALFGFERTAAISSQSASRIAKTAEHFGQDDDITVLTLTRLAAGEESAVAHKGPVLVTA
jgi:hypothetical protein